MSVNVCELQTTHTREAGGEICITREQIGDTFLAGCRVWLGRQLWCQAAPAEPSPKIAAELSFERGLCSFGLRLSSAPSLPGQEWGCWLG